MIRCYNYTDRLRIPRENIQVAWIDDGGGCLKFQCEINLELDRLLDPFGRVFLEAYSGAEVMRFSLGTVAHREPPSETRLTEFPPGLKPLFRVRVVDPGEERRILAWADRIVALAPDEVPSGRRSILPVETVDLGQRVWNLRIDSNTFFLQLNSAIREPQDITVTAREADFVALVYPTVIRQILSHLLFGPEAEAVESDHDWFEFARGLTGRPPPTQDEGHSDEEFHAEAEDWICATVNAFCESQFAVENFIKARKEREVSHA